ncbi:MAG: coenzyme F420-0:L-glutamate ligase [Nocardioidaceae bacterium]|nr:coenzyme F420-0:L-glutamate ligase [Nocardioidaceae bacterium]
MSGRLTVVAPDGVLEVRAGDDLVALLLDALAGEGESLADGDVVLVTSKVVAKAEGRVATGDRHEALLAQPHRVVARRGATLIVRTELGLTLAAGGIDASNVEAGRIVLLPEDPDASARAMRAAIQERTGVRVAVIVTDTAGRAWREGQTDLAIGAAGLRVVESFAGRTDSYGNPLVVTAPAVADELAGAAELAQGKLAARPFAVVRGRADLVLPVAEDGDGAGALVRPPTGDLFGFGAREAVVRALAGDPADQEAFGSPASPDELDRALTEVLGEGAAVATADGVVVAGPPEVVSAVAFAHGWLAEAGDEGVHVIPRPGPGARSRGATPPTP